MSLINFYPGPSRVESKVPKYVSEAYKSGIIGVNHRSEAFMDLVKRTTKLLKEKLEIPENYEIFFVSSATECWEIIAQSIIKKKSFHISYGSFAEKWVDINKNLNIKTDTVEVPIEDEINTDRLVINESHEIVCLTQNETSNGTQINGHNFQKIKLGFPDHLIAVDATSSLGGIYLNFELGDIWFASVQKCLGLPAGMALMICSPNAIKKAEEIDERKHYNSFLKIYDNMLKYQTHYTPNVLDIYLLNRVIEERPSIEKVGKQTLNRYSKWMKFLDTFDDINLLVKNDKTRSRTVIALESEPKTIIKIMDEAKKAGISLGKGYGKWKESSFRIANFPALKNHEITYLRTFFEAELN